MIVGLSGKKQSGKNLIAKIWQLIDVYYSDYLVHPNGGNKGTLKEFVLNYLEKEKNYKNLAHNFGSNWKQKSFAHKLKQIVCLLIGCTMGQLEDPIFKEKKLGKEWEVWYSETIYNLYICKEDVIKYQGDLKDYKQCFLTPRKLLQLIGTDCFRDIIHPEIWINALYADYKPTMTCFADENDWAGTCYDVDIYSNWLITDVRFKNEAESILKRDGILIRVNRFCYDSAEDFCVCNPDKEISKQGTHIVSNFSGDEFVQRINKLAVDNGYVPLKEQHTSETDLDDYNSFHYIIVNTGSIENLIEKVKEIMIKEKVINE